MRRILPYPHYTTYSLSHDGAGMNKPISFVLLELARAGQTHCSLQSKGNPITSISRADKKQSTLTHINIPHCQNTAHYRPYLQNHSDQDVLPTLFHHNLHPDFKACRKFCKIDNNRSNPHSTTVTDASDHEMRIGGQCSEILTGALLAAGLSCLVVSSAAMADTLVFADSMAALDLAPTKSCVANNAISSAGEGATSIPVVHTVPVFSGMRLLERVMHHLGGGGLAGAVGATVVYPFDTIKTRMQAQLKKDGEASHYKNELDCFWKLIQKEGLRSLYSGLLPQLIGIVPEKAMKLTVNELLLELLEDLMPGAGLWALELLAGGGGGFCQVVFTNPMEIVKVRLQTQAKSEVPKNTWDVVKELGFQGLYSGAGVTMARDIPSSGLFFACYGLLRQLYPEHSFLDGCLAAVPAIILSTPMDVIKTRLQMERAPGEKAYEDAWDCFWRLLEKEGHFALFSGGTARLLKICPQLGITLLIYDALCPKL